MTLLHRVLFVAWRNPLTGGIQPVARLMQHDSSPRYEFVYLRGARKATAGGGAAPLIEFPDLDRVYRSDALFPLFQNRLMPGSRPDYPDFFSRLALPQSLEAPIPILARSGGRRETDMIELFGYPSFLPERQSFAYPFFLRGVRHVEGAEQRISELKAGDPLTLRQEPDNRASALAVAVDGTDGGHLGWVPATLLEDLSNLQEKGSTLDLSVQQVNPVPAPVHERLLCRLEATMTPGFLPFSSEAYQPIPEEAHELQIDSAALVA